MPGYAHQKTADSLQGVDRAQCAVIVIDELGEVAGGPLEDVLLEPTLNTARICDAARAAAVPVIFANDAHIPGIDRELDLWGEHNLAGDAASQPSPELKLSESDHVIEKRRYSAFFQTSLRLLLDELEVSTLILCGFDTNICVMHTAADAYFNNYRIIVVEDATATFLIGDQQTGLDYMKRCYAATLASTEDVLEALR